MHFLMLSLTLGKFSSDEDVSILIIKLIHFFRLWCSSPWLFQIFVFLDSEYFWDQVVFDQHDQNVVIFWLKARCKMLIKIVYLMCFSCVWSSLIGAAPGRGSCPIQRPLTFDLIYTDYHGLAHLQGAMGLAFQHYQYVLSSSKHMMCIYKNKCMPCPLWLVYPDLFGDYKM